MTGGDILGWLAAALVFAAFLSRQMLSLRIFALLSNVAFISYGGLYHLWPIVGLHLAMFPVNILRLIQCFEVIGDL